MYMKKKKKTLITKMYMKLFKTMQTLSHTKQVVLCLPTKLNFPSIIFLAKLLLVLAIKIYHCCFYAVCLCRSFQKTKLQQAVKKEQIQNTPLYRINQSSNSELKISYHESS